MTDPPPPVWCPSIPILHPAVFQICIKWQIKIIAMQHQAFFDRQPIDNISGADYSIYFVLETSF